MTSIEKAVFLASARVILRPFSKDDAPRLHRWINDPEVRRFLTPHFPITLESEEEWVKSLSKQNDKEVLLAIETPEGEHIGSMGLHRINWIDRTSTTGALIGNKEYWGKGLGTEAKMLLLHYAFNTLNLRKICSQALVFNERSISYSKKCGYKEEGVLKEHIFREGKYWDLVQLAVFRDDFMPLWETWNESKR
jgi:RimJ/RimL family protein N-acetyltransferase